MHQRTDIDFIRQYCGKYGYKLLSTDYRNQKQKLDLLCPNEHIYPVSFTNFKRGDRCTICSGKRSGFTKQDAQQWLSDRGCKLVTEEYQNQRQLLDYLCKCGEPMKNTMQRLKNICKDPYCRQCRKSDAKRQRKNDAEEIMSKIWF